MGVNSYQESVFYHYILGNPIFLNTTKPEFFSNPILKDLFEIAKDHTIKYKEPPEKEQLSELVRIKGLGDKIKDEVIGALYNSKIQLQQYDDKWLEQNVGPWIRMKNLEYVMRKSIAFMKTANVGAENAAETVEKIRHMFSTETAIDFTFNLGNDFFDPKSHQQDRLARTSTGYPFIDLCLDGGWWKGSLIVFLSGPKSGKSMMLGNLAAQSVYNGYNTAYVTLELQKEIVAMRIGSNMISVPMDEYKEKSKDEDFMRKKLSALQQTAFRPLGKFHIQEFPSSTMGTTDLRSYLVKAQEILGYKFENVFVDYINIMKNWRNPNTENLYMKIKQISEDLRALAQEENWAVITATQTNRCISPYSIVNHKNKGKIMIKDISIGDFILGDSGYIEVKQIYNNLNTKTYKIKTKSGKEIVCSDTHLFPLSNGELKPLSEIRVGDKLLSKDEKSLA